VTSPLTSEREKVQIFERENENKQCREIESMVPEMSSETGIYRQGTDVNDDVRKRKRSWMTRGILGSSNFGIYEDRS